MLVRSREEEKVWSSLRVTPLFIVGLIEEGKTDKIGVFEAMLIRAKVLRESSILE